MACGILLLSFGKPPQSSRPWKTIVLFIITIILLQGGGNRVFIAAMNRPRRNIRRVDYRRLHEVGVDEDSTDDEEYEEPNSVGSSAEEEDNILESSEVKHYDSDETTL